MGSKVGARDDNQSAEIPQLCTKSQESTVNITEGGEDEWLISIKNYVNDTTKKPQIVSVPSLLREIQSNEDSFVPLIVSIGPYHHGNPKLEAFEELKIPIAQKFCHACENKVSIEQMYKAVAREGKSARECYEKGLTCFDDGKMFNKMMFLDACFVLYVLSTDLQREEQNEVTERLVKSFYTVLRDLLLLENQIPFLILKVLLEFRFQEKKDQTLCIQKFLEPQIKPPQGNSCTNAVKKFLAQMKGRRTKIDQEMTKWKLDLDSSPPHLLHLMRESLVRPFMHELENTATLVEWESYRSVTELKSTGIHFKRSQTGNFTDVEFKSRLIYGTLTLPSMVVDDRTRSLILNLVAYEKCPNGPSDWGITSYICLMDSLIDHPDDVKELRKKRILVNNLGSDEQLAQLFNEIAKDLVPNPVSYAHAKCQIENHYQDRVQVWMAECLHNHFRSPWAVVAFLGAIFVLLLTMVQTYFAVFRR